MSEKLSDSRTRIARVVRAALAGAAEQRPLPDRVVTAITDGTGEPATVRDAARQALGDTEPLELVVFDTDQIGSYVFESSRPPVIAGASRILNDLNARIGKQYADNVIFSGGGEGMLLVPAGKRAAEICSEIEGMFERKTCGALSVTTVAIPLRVEDFLPQAPEGDSGRPRTGAGVELVSGTRAVIARARDQVRRKKDERMPARAPVPGTQDRCVSCRDRSGVSPVSELRKDEPGLICEPCHRRWKVGRPLIAGTTFEEIVTALGDRLPAGEARRSRHLGFIYADGNSMGELFSGLGSLSELRFTSNAVRTVFQLVGERLEQMICKLMERDIRRESKVHLSLLGGGDEAIWLLPGALALQATRELSRWVDHEAHQIPELEAMLHAAGLHRLTVGIGLVLCEHKYPVRYQYRLAKALQENAKRLFYLAAERSTAPSSVDFELLTDLTPLGEDLDTSRRLLYGTAEPDFLLTCRPYDSRSFSQLLAIIESARNAKLATSQLHGLLAGAADGYRVFLNHARYQIARNEKKYEGWLSNEGIDLTDQQQLESFLTSPPGAAGADRDGKRAWLADANQLAPFIDLVRDLGQRR